MNSAGPVSEFVQAALAEFPIYRDYLAGRITREKYVEGLEAQAAQIEASLGGARNLLTAASRYPADFDQHADDVFADLLARRFVSEDPSVEAFVKFRKTVFGAYDHGDNRTFIHPDEARLAYFVSMATKPKLMVTIGSYYGYWAIWAMPGVAATGGRAILIDPNPAVCALARKNFQALGFGERATVRAEKAEAVLPELAPNSVDLVLLDAAGGKDNPDPSYNGKGIYAFMVEDVFDKMREGALLITHNDYRVGVGANQISQPMIERSVKQLERFHAFCQRKFRKSHVAPTPDGFGIYLK
jgi:predicted O-methyltransferase YrrM